MVSVHRFINLEDTFRIFELSTMPVAEKVALKKKLKSELAHVRSATERIEADHRKISSESEQQSLLVVEKNQIASGKLQKKSVRDKLSQNPKSCVDDTVTVESKVKAAMPCSNSSNKQPSRILDAQVGKKRKMDSSVIQQCSGIVKTAMPCSNSSNKRPSRILDVQVGKKRKMDGSVIQQCSGILKTLMSHPAGWLFNQAVDPVALSIPDYFSIISKPMDLGTIRSKLQKKLYWSTQEFAADVRLTFSNAMLYNPPSNDVHVMAKELDRIFNLRWKSFEAKWSGESTNIGQQSICNEKPKKAPNVQSGGLTNSCGHVPLKKGLNKGNDTRQLCDSANVKLHMNSDACLTSCGGHNELAQASFSDIDSDRSSGRERQAFPDGVLNPGCATNVRPNIHTSKSDPDSDGAVTVSTVDEENVQSISLPPTPARFAASGEESKDPLYDGQISPSKALRAAMLKSRFADTILKAQHKTLLNHGEKADPVKMQRERERLERKQREEKARIEAQIKAAEEASRLRVEAELKMQREKEREAARIALQKMEKTVEIDENQDSMKDLEMLVGYSLLNQLNNEALGGDIADGLEVVMLGSLEGGHHRNVLEQLGLFMKHDHMEEEEEEEAFLNGDVEEGEIGS